jgi:NAD dependent epimerase/dehydratase family enzyme
MADEALLASTRVLPTRLLGAGFQFQYPTLPEAFACALKPENTPSV